MSCSKPVQGDQAGFPGAMTHPVAATHRLAASRDLFAGLEEFSSQIGPVD